MQLVGKVQGNTPEPWLGPDVQDLTRNFIKKKDIRHLFIYQLASYRAFGGTV